MSGQGSGQAGDLSPLRIRTSFEFPPIPDRSHDWSAVDDDCYEPGPGRGGLVGWGRTEAEAVADLVEQVREWDEEHAEGGRIVTVKVATYGIAHAAGWDAGNRSMRAAGRERWNETDLETAREAMERVLRVANSLAAATDEKGEPRP